jgi:acyl-coenzyme A synthetase/AMP-(fatty) acid ligase
LDEVQLRVWWSERLVHYQQPKFVMFVDELPRNSLGKVLRREVRATLEKVATGG